MKIFVNDTSCTTIVTGDAKWTLYLKTNIPNFKSIWKDMNGTELNANSGKYTILVSKDRFSQYKVLLRISNVVREDAGHYQFQVKSADLNEQSQIVDLVLVVHGNEISYLKIYNECKIYLYMLFLYAASRTVKVKSNENKLNYFANCRYNISCTVPRTSSPQWYFYSCNTWSTCGNPTKV